MRVGIYCRVSTEGQIENTSLSYQQKRGIDFCISNGHDYTLFSEQISGGVILEDRRMFEELTKKLLNRELDAIWLLSWDRGWRDDLIKHYFIQLVRSSGCVVFVDGVKKDVLSSEGMFELGFFSLMNDFERNRIKSRLTNGKRSRWREGVGISGKIPFGYRKKIGGGWEIDEKTSRVVKDIFNFYLYKSVISVHDVHQRVIRKYGEYFNERRLSYDLVANVLSSEYYSGIYKIRDKELNEVFEFNIGSIVDDFTLQRVKDKKDSNTSLKKTLDKQDFLLKGKVKCSNCGQLMWVQTQVQNGVRYSNYICQHIKRGKLLSISSIGKEDFESCSNVEGNKVNVKKLEKAVWFSLIEFLKDSDRYKSQYVNKYSTGRTSREVILSKITYYTKALEKWKSRKLKVLTQFVDVEDGKTLFDNWNREQYQVSVAHIENRLAEYMVKLEGYDTSIDVLSSVIDSMNRDLLVLKDSEDFKERRAMVVEYVREVKVFRLSKSEFKIEVILYDNKGDGGGRRIFNVLSGFSVKRSKRIHYNLIVLVLEFDLCMQSLGLAVCINGFELK